MISVRHIEFEPVSADGSGVHIHPPEVAATVVVRPAPGPRPEIVVLGPRTRARYVRTGSESQQCAVARIHPGDLRPLLGRLRVADLVDRAVLLHRLRGVPAEVAASSIGSGTTVSAVAQHLRSTLLDRLSDQPGATVHRDLLADAQRALAGETDIAMPARDLGISERHLRTLFSHEMGLSPKHFAQILRVRRVAELARSGDLAQVARQAGYYDQAHMTTEFRRIMGVPPGRYAVGRYPEPQGCGDRAAIGVTDHPTRRDL